MSCVGDISFSSVLNLLTAAWKDILSDIPVSKGALKTWNGVDYTKISLDPLVACSALMVVVSLVCWVASVVIRNYSHVDRLWSIIPFVYTWVFVYFVDGPILSYNRVSLMSILCTCWGIRLTYNFARKGGYNLKEEDYRWAVVKKAMHPIFFQIFNFLFIAFYQNLLLFLITTPIYIVWKCGNYEITHFDWMLTAIYIVLLCGEFIADEQQWRFHASKHALKEEEREGTPYEDGFLQTGLFYYSRHPNFFCEISIWWITYGFSVLAQNVQTPEPQYYNWTIIGAVLLTILFHGSTNLTEAISVEKYPAYRDRYQRTTSRIFPWIPLQKKKKKSSKQRKKKQQ